MRKKKDRPKGQQSLRDQLLKMDLLKLAGSDKPKLHKAYRILKCREAGRVCEICTEWRYKMCLDTYGANGE